jgi:opacity protein-like surface antigen
VDAKELLSAFGVEDVEGNYALTHGDLGVRWHFLPGRVLVPYADVAVSSRRVSTEIEGEDGQGNPVEGELKMTGGVGFAVGGGVQYFFKPNLALDTQLKLNFGGSFDKAEFDGDEIQGFEDTSASSARLFVGVSWYPMANRMSGRR